jgi:hypothetical protein
LRSVTAIREFTEQRPEALHPVTARWSAALIDFRQWTAHGALPTDGTAADRPVGRGGLYPTAGTPLIAEVDTTDPLNSNLATHHHEPARSVRDRGAGGLQPDGPPFGVTPIVPRLPTRPCASWRRGASGRPDDGRHRRPAASGAPRRLVCDAIPPRSAARMSGLP